MGKVIPVCGDKEDDCFTKMVSMEITGKEIFEALKNTRNHSLRVSRTIFFQAGETLGQVHWGRSVSTCSGKNKEVECLKQSLRFGWWFNQIMSPGGCWKILYFFSE